MIHTALSATHMVDISLRDPGGGEMIKVRLQGTKEDILITVQMAITPIVISGLVKGSDAITARMF